MTARAAKSGDFASGAAQPALANPSAEAVADVAKAVGSINFGGKTWAGLGAFLSLCATWGQAMYTEAVALNKNTTACTVELKAVRKEIRSLKGVIAHQKGIQVGQTPPDDDEDGGG